MKTSFKGKVATATNQHGEVVATSSIENCYLVVPKTAATSMKDCYDAGVALEEALLTHAQLKGVTRLLIVLPDGFPPDPQERLIRVVERKVPQLGYSPVVPQATTQYLN
jgi:hypothetical protein